MTKSENEKPGNEKLNSRFKPEKNRLKPGKGHFLVYFNKIEKQISKMNKLGWFL